MAKKTEIKAITDTGDLPKDTTISEGATDSERTIVSDVAAAIQSSPAAIPERANSVAANKGDDPLPPKAVMARTVKLDGKLYREGDELDVSKSVFAKLSALGAVVEARKA